jgi:SAM-dependent methyltransferase
MLSRLGYAVSVVDIEETALDGIRAQAESLGLSLQAEQAGFGFGFEEQRFDCILFYEAFHHAFEFEELLERLHERINPGGRVLLCGEPVVPSATDGIPYPWGPRMDALSVFCIRKFGWMELGFTHEFLIEVCRRHGWTATFHPFPNCGRAEIWVLEPTIADQSESHDRPDPPPLDVQPEAPAAAPVPDEVQRLQRELAAVRGSTSWQVTRPLRAAKDVLNRIRSARKR